MKLSQLYKNVYDSEYKNQPRWKQLAIDEDLVLNKQSSIVDDFIRGVILKAELDFDSKIVESKQKKTKKKKVEQCDAHDLTSRI
jgi:hypothetical protein